MTTSAESGTCRVAIVGGGPAGLAAATALAAAGVERVTVIEREKAAGGIPRHCGHYPFGMREFRRLLRGPDYARRLAAAAEAAGVELRLGTTVVGLGPGPRLFLSDAGGAAALRADKVLLATGVRERSRAARLVGGARPKGVMTTGSLQSLVYLKGLRPFRRPLIVGSELVSFSALLTCRHAGIAPVAMVEPGPRVVARSFAAGLPRLLRVPLLLGTRIERIMGERRVEAVELADSEGRHREVEVDGVVFTGRFLPEAALARGSHLELDAASGGPLVDQYLRCSDPDFFAAGNLLRPVETAGWSWAEGGRAAARIARALDGGLTDEGEWIDLNLASPKLRYVLPQSLLLDGPEGGERHLQLRAAAPLHGTLAFYQEEKLLHRQSVGALPERRILVPLAPILAAAAPGIVDVTFEERD